MRKDLGFNVTYAVQNRFAVYEENFSRLTALLPELESVRDDLVLRAEGVPDLQVKLVDRSPYTTTIQLSHSLGVDERFVRALYMKIRIYRDARVLEVLAYQNSGHFKALYPYPNPSMFQPYEKRRVNQFLGEWLAYCLRQGYHLEAPSNGAFASR